jgi:hypothetical protein
MTTTAPPLTRVFSPHRWVNWVTRGRSIPPGLSLYAAYGEPGDSRATCFGPGLAESYRTSMIGLEPGEPGPVLKWIVLAPSWEAAMTRYHELQGWEPYVPMRD